jgi:hypothetical protein
MAGDETACKMVEKVSGAILNGRAFPMYTCMGPSEMNPTALGKREWASGKEGDIGRW